MNNLVLNLGGVDYKLNFGLRFLEYVDKNHQMGVGGNVSIGFGVGLHSVILGLKTQNVGTLEEIIKGGTITEKTKPSNDDIAEYIIKISEDEEVFDKTFEDFFIALTTAPILKGTTRKIVKELGLA